MRISVPDIGSDEKVEVVEILVAPGEEIAVDAGLVTLESDKATMDVPSPAAGTVGKVLVKVGDKVGTGDAILELEEAVGAPAAGEPQAPGRPEPPAEPESEPESGAAAGPESPPEPGPGREAETEPEAAAETAASRPEPEPPPAEKPAAPPVRAAGGADADAEVLVLGAGPGGYTAAFRAADLGKRVVLVERYASLGGVCLNVGCIPSKALLHVARVVDEAAELADRGVEFGAPSFDLPRLREWKDKTVSRLTGGLATMARQRGVEVVQGAGTFAGPRELSVATADGARSVRFETAIIAAGSRVVEIPGIPYDDSRVMDSTAALELADVPARLLVVGGGIIGLEMATVYGALGSEVTVVELLPGLLPGCDPDLVKPLERRLKRRYKAKLYTATKVVEVASGEEGLTARFDGAKAPESAVFDRVLVAVGRRPNGDRLNLEAAGVVADERGFIPVDRQQRTNVPHIFAIGDVTGQPMLAHKATHEGRVAAEVAAGEKSAFDARIIPSVAYTDPEIAWAGLTESAAAEGGIAYEVGSFPWVASGRALGIGRTDGLTKLLFDPASKRLLGAGIVGPGAGDLIAEVALAIEMDCEAADIALTIHPHPTLSETVAFAAEAFEGTITDLYLGKKRR